MNKAHFMGQCQLLCSSYQSHYAVRRKATLWSNVSFSLRRGQCQLPHKTGQNWAMPASPPGGSNATFPIKWQICLFFLPIALRSKKKVVCLSYQLHYVVRRMAILWSNASFSLRGSNASFPIKGPKLGNASFPTRRGQCHLPHKMGKFVCFVIPIAFAGKKNGHFMEQCQLPRSRGQCHLLHKMGKFVCSSYQSHYPVRRMATLWGNLSFSLRREQCHLPHKMGKFVCSSYQSHYPVRRNPLYGAMSASL